MGSKRYHDELVDRAYRQVIGSDKCREFFDLVEKEAEEYVVQRLLAMWDKEHS